MSASEKLCLQWNDFKENLTSSFRELREDKEFTDITLASEDGQHVEAHKVVLASSSPFFMELLKKNKHSHPLVYMRGLKSEDLIAILDFLYFGEANVFQSNLDSFLGLAEELRLKGLAGGADAGQEPENTTPPKKRVHMKKDMDQQLHPPPFQSDHNQTPTIKSSKDTTVALTNDQNSVADLRELDEMIKSMITKSDVKTNNGQGYMATCNVCGKEGRFKTMPRHVEANHITGISHACPVCGKMFRSRNSLQAHLFSIHQNNRSTNAGQKEV